MTLLLSALLAASAIDQPVVCSRADIVEVNHCFDASWRLMFDQVIWWELADDGYRVVDWRILYNVRCCGGQNVAGGPPAFKGGHATPRYCHARRRWISTWYDEKCRTRREVAAVGFRETETQFDPELKDRQRHPERDRRGLAKKSQPRR